MNEQLVILAMYIDVGTIPVHEVSNYMKEVEKQLKETKTDGYKVVQYYIPTRDEKTRIELVYPQVTIDEKLLNKLKQLNNKTKRIKK